jgi:hypothetical protein
MKLYILPKNTFKEIDKKSSVQSEYKENNQDCT